MKSYFKKNTEPKLSLKMEHDVKVKISQDKEIEKKDKTLTAGNNSLETVDGLVKKLKYCVDK